MARRAADHAVDRIRGRFGWDAIGYGSVALGTSSSVPDKLRKLAEKSTEIRADLSERDATIYPPMTLRILRAA